MNVRLSTCLSTDKMLVKTVFENSIFIKSENLPEKLLPDNHNTHSSLGIFIDTDDFAQVIDGRFDACFHGSQRYIQLFGHFALRVSFKV